MPLLDKFLLGNPLLLILLPAMQRWNTVLNFTLKTIAERRQSVTDRQLVAEKGEIEKDQLSRWTAIMEATPNRISFSELVAHTSANVFAGSDPNAIALRTIFYYLLRNPATMDRAVREIDKAHDAGVLSKFITYKESLNHLKYVGAVIKEGVRIFSPVGIILERVVPVDGFEIYGKVIPAGTVVGVNPWVMGHDATVFPEPEMFTPERWL